MSIVPRRETLDVAYFLATPSAPSVVPTGTNDSVSRSYKLVAIDADGGTAAASSAGSDSSGATTQDGSNFETLTWTDVTGATSYDVYRTVGAVTGKIANVLQGVQTLNDTGLVGNGATAPSSNTSGIGSAHNISANSGAAVYVQGTFVGTLKIQVSQDGSVFHDVSTLTAPGYASLPQCMQVRVKMTAYTSGTPSATLVLTRNY